MPQVSQEVAGVLPCLAAPGPTRLLLLLADQIARVLETEGVETANLLEDVMVEYAQMVREAEAAQNVLAERDAREQTIKESYEERERKLIAELTHLREFKRIQSYNVKDMLQRVDSLGAGPKVGWRGGAGRVRGRGRGARRRLAVRG